MGQALELPALQPGDLGWIVERHGAFYAAEYGLGKRLVRQCSDFARAAGCERIVLWTQRALPGSVSA